MFAGKNMTIEDIAEREHVTVLRVQESIDRMKEYSFRHSNEVVALRVNELFIQKIEKMGKVFDRGLMAKKSIRVGRDKFKDVPDVAMQLKAVETIKSMQEIAQPKAPLVQNNTQFNNNLNSPGYQPGMSFESRLRIAREKRGMKNEEADEIIDAVEVDDGPTLEEEFEGIGVDLAEGEEGEDEQP